MFTHDVIYLRDDSKNVSVINYLRGFLFMILNILMILIILIIFLCVSSAISRSHLKMKSYHINGRCLALELAFKEINQFLINFTTRVLYVPIVITYMTLELACSCLNTRFKSDNCSLITSAFIFLLQYA